MRVLIAPDKFKGSLTALEVCKSIEEGLHASLPEANCVLFPLADGGEGTLEILTRHADGNFIIIKVHDPLFRLRDASYGISSDGKTAFIDMAEASGLKLLNASERSAMKASTFGTGELIRDAISRGVTDIVVGIGGSATNDGAAGAALALGYQFLDEKGSEINPVGGNLIHINAIRTDNVNRPLKSIRFTAICDVENPLTGPNGAAFVYGPQKQATPEQLILLDDGLKNLAKVIHRDLGVSISDVPGAGAGGGFGGGLIAFFNGTLKKGIEIVFQYTGFENEVKRADLIITGEGKLDTQTLQGKVVAGVAAMGKKHHKKVVCVTGSNELSKGEIEELGIFKVLTLVEHTSKEMAMNHASDILKKVVMSLTIDGLDFSGTIK
ncbi:MAG TPA: glycerate kinase [Cyclobacteriaceae bacterium]|nr:glycerate kinase [Cyclobacteriaceae bacterium]